MSVFDDFFQANQAYTQSFTAGDLPRPPTRKVAVLTCMDARLHRKRFWASLLAMRM